MSDPELPDGGRPDGELSDRESDRLRTLLQHGAARVPVPATPAAPRVTPLSAPARSATTPNRRAAWLAFAAALLVVAAAGGTWWTLAHDRDHVNAGPADTPTTTTAEPTTDAELWRLPVGLDDLQLVAAQDRGIFTSTFDTRWGMLALDDPEQPERWLQVEAFAQFNGEPVGAEYHQLGDGVRAMVVPPDEHRESTWFQIEFEQLEDIDRLKYLTGSVSDVDATELVELLRRRFAAPADTSAAGPAPAGTVTPETLTAAFDGLRSDIGLEDATTFDWSNPTFDDVPIQRSLELTLLGEQGDELMVTIQQDPTSPSWAQQARERIRGELDTFAYVDRVSSAGPSSFHQRSDLGPGITANSSWLGGAQTQILDVSADGGIRTSAIRDLPPSDDGDPSTIEPPPMPPLTEAEQLRIIRSLRPMSEEEFHERLAELGIEFIDLTPGN